VRWRSTKSSSIRSRNRKKPRCSTTFRKLRPFLADYFAPRHLRSLIIFRSERSSTKRSAAGAHQRRIEDDPDPYIAPLEPFWRRTKKSCSSSAGRKTPKCCFQLGASSRSTASSLLFLPIVRIGPFRTMAAAPAYALATASESRWPAKSSSIRSWLCDLLVLMAETRSPQCLTNTCTNR